MSSEKKIRLEIADGSTQFYQWDSGQRLVVIDDGTCNEVHFTNCLRENTLVCKICERDGVRVVDVPDVLLQDAESITAYMHYFDMDGRKTYHSQSFHLLARKKPEDYIYTETEVRTYDKLEARITALENLGAVDLKTMENSIQQYMQKHPITPESIGALPAEQLPNAVNDALAQAKANGEFKGDSGPQGPQGKTGPQGEKGDKGDTGTEGYTPIKGVDYWTEADKEAIVQEVITALGTPVFGTVDNENNIILTGVLVDGTYTLKYEDADGEQVEIGTVEIGGITYTNLLPLAVGCDGKIQQNINGDVLGYADGYYLSGNGSNPWKNMSYVGEDTTHFLTGFIPYTKAQAEAGIPIYIKGVTIDTTQSHTRAAGFNTYSDYSAYHDPVKFSTGYITVQELATGYYKLTPTANFVSTMASSTAGSNFQYIRFSFTGSGAGVIITVNEEIE